MSELGLSVLSEIRAYLFSLRPIFFRARRCNAGKLQPGTLGDVRCCLLLFLR